MVQPADYAIDVLEPSEERYRRSPQEWKQDYRVSEEYQTWVRARQQGPIRLS